MASDSALRHLTIGQYIPTGSLLHRLDPRVKIVAVGLLIIAVIIATHYTNNLLLLLFVLTLVGLSRLPLGYLLAGIKPALLVIVLLALLQLLFFGDSAAGEASRVLFAWGPVRVSTGGLRFAVVLLVRFINLLLLTSLLSNTTTTSALIHGLENLLRPVSAVGLPGHELALVGAIALRFLPILGEQLESITQAQASRGVGFQKQTRWQIVRNAQRLAALVVPLFVDVYRRSEEMILAMQARCYQGGRKRTHLRVLHLTASDYLAAGCIASVVSLTFVLQALALP